jgi:Resolvase, N terminal domain
MRCGLPVQAPSCGTHKHPGREDAFTILGAVAELERSIIAERVKAGQQTAKANGKHIGRPPASVDGHALRDVLAAGHSMAQVAAALGISAATVCRRAQGGSLVKQVRTDGGRSPPPCPTILIRSPDTPASEFPTAQAAKQATPDRTTCPPNRIRKARRTQVHPVASALVFVAYEPPLEPL